MPYTAQPPTYRMTTVDIFIAYSHQDLAFKNEFKKFLRPMLREGRISIWDDYDIEAGQEWDAAIKERLYGAGIILLLVSSDSLASDYFYGKEVKVSLERHQKGEAVVVPVILRHCDWENTPLGGLEALPEKGRPVADWADRQDRHDAGWQDVVNRLRRVVETVAQRQAAATARSAQQQRFAAAVEAAGHLFEREQWAEARKAYSDALTLHETGFVPVAALLQQRVADCEQQLDRQARETRKVAFDKTLARADILFAQENWLEALAAYRQAESQQEPDFPATEASRRIGERIAACEAQMRPKAPPKAPKPPKVRVVGHKTPPAHSQAGGGFQWWYYLAIGTLVLVVLLAVWRPWQRNDTPAKGLTPLRREAPAQPTGEEQAFDVAKNTGTIPALAAFLLRFPTHPEAQKLSRDLKNRFDQKLKSAQSFERAEEWALARARYKEALALNPDDKKIQNKLKSLPNK
ncbi:MAG: toll/interleukin-1 receptor domain-containing protein [Saprospiraceae bacterium]|nr:toll/interleukin-1 receptor domain-containing protein [Saprospiraceae bacterium]